MNKFAKLIIFTDGGARGNPGPAACGVVIKDICNQTIAEYGNYLGKATNNVAEYNGVILALEKVSQMNLGTEEIVFYLDSELVVKQLNREYKVKDLNLQSLFVKIWNLSKNFKKIAYNHVPREQNKEADRLVNQELDRQKGVV